MKQLRQLSTETPNEIRLMHLPSQTLVAAMNTPAENNKGADSKANQG